MGHGHGSLRSLHRKKAYAFDPLECVSGSFQTPSGKCVTFVSRGTNSVGGLEKVHDLAPHGYMHINGISTLAYFVVARR